jgi:hypothetical protein
MDFSGLDDVMPVVQRQRPGFPLMAHHRVRHQVLQHH